MRSKYTGKFAAGAAPHLEPGERVLTALIAQARGRSQRVAAAGSSLVASELGARKQRAAMAAAEATGLAVDNPMALALTNRRLLTFKISAPVLGRGGAVKELLGAVGLDRVDGLEVKRAGLGRRITVTVDGVAVELEAAAGADELREAFEAARP